MHRYPSSIESIGIAETYANRNSNCRNCLKTKWRVIMVVCKTLVWTLWKVTAFPASLSLASHVRSVLCLHSVWTWSLWLVQFHLLSWVTVASSCQELEFVQLKTKRKRKCSSCLCSSHFFFVDSVPVRLFLCVQLLYGAWTLHQRSFNHSYSQPLDT